MTKTNSDSTFSTGINAKRITLQTFQDSVYLTGGGVGRRTVVHRAASLLTAPFNPEFDLLSVWSYSRSPSVHLGFIWVPWFPPTSVKHVRRWTGYAKLLLGGN